MGIATAILSRILHAMCGGNHRNLGSNYSCIGVAYHAAYYDEHTCGATHSHLPSSIFAIKGFAGNSPSPL